MKQQTLSPDLTAVLFNNGCLEIYDPTYPRQEERLIRFSPTETEELRKLLNSTKKGNDSNEHK